MVKYDGHPARGDLVDQRRAEIVEVVEVHDVGAHLLQRPFERGGDGRVVDLAVGVAQVKQPVRPVVHADQAYAVLDPFDDLVGLL